MFYLHEIVYCIVTKNINKINFILFIYLVSNITVIFEYTLKLRK